MKGLLWSAGAAALLLLGLELALRAFGALQPGRPSTPRAELTILTEGDSFTFGIGGSSYPSQLEALLNQGLERPRFRVVDRGIPGENPSELADGLEAHLREVRPDLLVVIMGANDTWNLANLRVPGVNVPLALRLEGLLSRLRVWRLVKLILIGFRTGGLPALSPSASPSGAPGLGMALCQARQFEKAEEAWRAELRRKPDSWDVYRDRAECYLMTARYREAVETLEEARRRLPGETGALHRLARARHELGREEPARRLWAQALREHPRKDEVYESMAEDVCRRDFERGTGLWEKALLANPRSSDAFRELALCWQRHRGDAAPALELAERLPGVRENAAFRELAELRRLAGQKGWSLGELLEASLRWNADRVASIAKSRGVRLVFASYPELAYEPVRRAALEAGVPYVDFRPIFRDRFAEREAFLSRDLCHCNTAGYGLMAEVLAGVARSEFGETGRLEDPVAGR